MVNPRCRIWTSSRRVKERFGVPVMAYNVSGNTMVRRGANGWIDERG